MKNDVLVFLAFIACLNASEERQCKAENIKTVFDVFGYFRVFNCCDYIKTSLAEMIKTVKDKDDTPFPLQGFFAEIGLQKDGCMCEPLEILFQLCNVTLSDTPCALLYCIDKGEI